jgi:hypothetical protein
MGRSLRRSKDVAGLEIGLGGGAVGFNGRYQHPIVRVGGGWGWVGDNRYLAGEPKNAEQRRQAQQNGRNGDERDRQGTFLSVRPL